MGVSGRTGITAMQDQPVVRFVDQVFREITNKDFLYCKWGRCRGRNKTKSVAHPEYMGIDRHIGLGINY